MNKALSQPFHAEAVIPSEVKRIRQLASDADETFFAVGSSLERAGKDLTSLRGLFQDIEQGLGNDAAEQFACMVLALTQESDRLSVNLDRFVDEASRLQVASIHVAAQIGVLERVVRTISTLSITARVIGHALSPPDRKVAAFVENLSHMSSEAEHIVSDLTAAMESIRQDTRDLPGGVERAQEIFRTKVLTQFAGLVEAARNLQERRPRLVAANAKLDAEMSVVATEVSRLIMALQVGDAFRQRLERVAVTMEESRFLHDDAALALSHRLTITLLQDACADMDEKTSKAAQSLSELEQASALAVRTARDAYLDGSSKAADGNGLLGMARQLDSRLADVDDIQRELLRRTERVVREVQQILTQEKTLRQIAHKVRLAGLNAIVICTQLGSRGNALREVAQWLRTMTDEADEATKGLQSALQEMSALIDLVGDKCLSDLAEGTSNIVAQGQVLHAAMEEKHRLIAEVSHSIQGIGADLPARLRPARSELAGFATKTLRLSQTADVLEDMGAAPEGTVLCFVDGSQEAEHFAFLRRGYTMAVEREIHDRVIGNPISPAKPETASVADAEPTPGATASDDFDDILF